MLETFMFCATLESGAEFLAWSGIVIYILSLCSLSMLLLFGSAIITAIFSAMVGFQGDNHSRYRRETDDSELLDNGYMKDFSEIVKRSSGDGSEGLVAALGVGIAVIIAFVVLIYAVLIVKLWASVNLLNGTKKRDHNLIFRYLIVDGIVILGTSYFMFQSIFYSVVQCLFIYFSVCTYSLYEKIKNEQGTAQCQLTTIQSIPMVENVQQIQPGVLQITTSQQPQEYPQKYPQDRGFQQTQVDQQPPTYQELSKSAEAVQ